jgi:hypothetical protein
VISHPCRRPSLVSWAFAGLLACALGLRRWWLTGAACTRRVECEPRRRDLFRPLVVALENREGPTTLFGLPFPSLLGGWFNGSPPTLLILYTVVQTRRIEEEGRSPHYLIAEGGHD